MTPKLRDKELDKMVDTDLDFWREIREREAEFEADPLNLGKES